MKFGDYISPRERSELITTCKGDLLIRAKNAEARIAELEGKKRLRLIDGTEIRLPDINKIKAEGIRELRDALFHIGSNEYHKLTKYADKLEKGE